MENNKSICTLLVLLLVNKARMKTCGNLHGKTEDQYLKKLYASRFDLYEDLGQELAYQIRKSWTSLAGVQSVRKLFKTAL